MVVQACLSEHLKLHISSVSIFRNLLKRHDVAEPALLVEFVFVNLLPLLCTPFSMSL